jgi:hypothetical protein
MFDLIPHRKGGPNHVPSFITQYGPIREVRFQRNSDGTPDGGVHALFSVVGRSDVGAPGCTVADLPPPDFETQYRKGNLSFRIPLQLFGLGLIESIQDQTILSNSASTAHLRAPFWASEECRIAAVALKFRPRTNNELPRTKVPAMDAPCYLDSCVDSLS